MTGPVEADRSGKDPPVAGTALPVDRAAAFATRATPVPRRFIRWVVVAGVVLGVGGELVEHVLDDHGIPSYSVSASTATAVSASSTGAGQQYSSGAALRQFMGVSRLSGARAPDFELTDQNGEQIGLGSLRGKIVVLAFMDAACDDICPVLVPELAKADRALGRSSARVDFVAVNTDPVVASVARIRTAATRSGLAVRTNWYFLTGSLNSLDPVWREYGITVEVGRATRKVAHTDALYFIDGTGRDRLRATPFADERRTGVSSLPSASLDEFAEGIASYARQLLVDEDRS